MGNPEWGPMRENNVNYIHWYIARELAIGVFLYSAFCNTFSRNVLLENKKRFLYSCNTTNPSLAFQSTEGTQHAMFRDCEVSVNSILHWVFLRGVSNWVLLVLLQVVGRRSMYITSKYCISFGFPRVSYTPHFRGCWILDLGTYISADIKLWPHRSSWLPSELGPMPCCVSSALLGSWTGTTES